MGRNGTKNITTICFTCLTQIIRTAIVSGNDVLDMRKGELINAGVMIDVALRAPSPPL